MRETTLCYIQRDGHYLMLHRIKKSQDPNQGKWIGIGGGIEPGETSQQCLLREVWEETGLKLLRWKKRGIVDFVSDLWPDERMHLYTADRFSGQLRDCDEGVLKWVPQEAVLDLSLWEGDRIFLKLLRQELPEFHLRLEYQGDALARAVFNGKELHL